MFHAMESGELRALYVIGENPAQSEADQQHAVELLEGLDHLVVQDIFLTKTAQLADVVLPASASWAEAEGTVTSSERRVQRVRKALDPPGEARDDVEIVYELGRRLGVRPRLAARRGRVERAAQPLADARAACRTRASRSSAGSRGPATTRSIPASSSCTRGSGQTRCRVRAPFKAVLHDPPVDMLDDDFPIRLTTGRRLESFNTGVQIGRLRLAAAPRRRARSGSRRRTARATASPTAGACASSRVAARSRRRAAYDDTLRPGLAFMNLHFPDEVATNVLTIDAQDPQSGTAEFKATAIRVEAV